MGSGIVAYDARCGYCSDFRKLLDFMDPNGHLGFVSLAVAEDSGILADVHPSLRFRSSHLVLPDGRIASGATAPPALVGLLPAGKLNSKVLECVPFGIRLLRFVYSALSRLHETGSCRA